MVLAALILCVILCCVILWLLCYLKQKKRKPNHLNPGEIGFRRMGTDPQRSAKQFVIIEELNEEKIELPESVEA